MMINAIQKKKEHTECMGDGNVLYFKENNQEESQLRG